jgi:hypothetical protein
MYVLAFTRPLLFSNQVVFSQTVTDSNMQKMNENVDNIMEILAGRAATPSSDPLELKQDSSGTAKKVLSLGSLLRLTGPFVF